MVEKVTHYDMNREWNDLKVNRSTFVVVVNSIFNRHSIFKYLMGGFVGRARTDKTVFELTDLGKHESNMMTLYLNHQTSAPNASLNR